jgi:tetratricopeptide (TPR) repeat protein
VTTTRSRLRPRAGLAIAAGLIALAAVTARSAPHLTRSDLLAKAYDSTLNADFEQAARDRAAACGPAPKEACQLLVLTAERWQLELDPDNRSRDQHLFAGIDDAIRAAEAWTAREPSKAEAWFYLGAAAGMRAELHGIRLERLAAARDGRRIKQALERALALDPGLADARFGLGVYRYVAGVVPAPVKLLLWLLMLPGGDRAQGLADMETARQRGELLRGAADFQLHWFFLWYEQQPDRALALLEGLRGRYPRNPAFIWRVAEVQDVYFHDRAASRDTFQTLIDAAAAGRVGAPAIASVRAQIGFGEQLDELFESDRAVEVLRAVVAARPSAPYGSLGRAQYLLGAAHDRLGRRDLAVAAYQAALAWLPADDPANLRPLVRTRLAHAPDRRATEAFRLSLEGWRLFERRALDAADIALARSIELNPVDPVARVRLGALCAARGERERALAEFERAIRSQPRPPPTFLAAAYLESARLLEVMNQRDRAIDRYRSALRVRGAEPRTREESVAALARLHISERSF